ncbi:MAG: hypothetical protein R3B96_05055 [Pirellulaceae bacterium]|nr:hypothetical protein [Planctomycetales bacterium]
MLDQKQVLDRYYLETRCQLVEIAATLDRFDRAESQGEAPQDPRLDQIYASLELLSRSRTSADRSRRLLEMFSDPA